MKRYVITAVLTCVFAGSAGAQGFDIAAETLFLGRQPDARVEAMGRAMAAGNAGPFALYYNPAGLARSAKITAGFSDASPFFYLKNAKFRYYSAVYNSGKYGAFGFSYHRYENYLGSGYSNPDIGNKVENLTAGYGLEPFQGWTIGAAISYLKDTETIRITTPTSPNGTSIPKDIKRDMLYFDAGIQKYMTVFEGDSRTLSIAAGAAAKNLTKSEIVWEPDWEYGEVKEKMPAVFTIGMTAEAVFDDLLNNPDLTDLQAVLTLNAMDLLNYDYRTTQSIGAEVTLLEIVSARAGYFTETQPENGAGDKRDDFTYGFGLHLPFEKLIGDTWPVSVSFDYIEKSHALFPGSIGDIGNFHVFSVRIQYMR